MPTIIRQDRNKFLPCRYLLPVEDQFLKLKKSQPQDPITTMNPFSIFSRLGGDPQGSLRDCSEKARIDSASQGATLLLPMIIWGAGGFATAHMMNAGLIACFVTSMSLAIIILILDRGMMSYVSKAKRSSLGIIARFILAIAGSIVFAHPAVFIVAKGVIERELTADVENAVEARKSEIEPQLAEARKRLASSAAILRDTASAANIAFIEKNEELKEARKAVERWTNAADDEANGLRGSSALQGEGTKFKRAEKYKNEAKLTVKNLESELANARKASHSAQQALTSAIVLKVNDPEIRRLENDLNLALGKIRGHDQGDPFSRFEALHAVIGRNWAAGSYSLGVGYIIVCIVLLGFEVIPVCLKLGAGGGELALLLELQLFKAEQDNANYKEVYPTLSMAMTRHRLQIDVYREQLKLDNELSMDRIRVPSEKVRSILVEQAQVFKLADDLLRRSEKSKNVRNAEFSETLSNQLIDAFQRAVEAEMGSGKPKQTNHDDDALAA